MESKGAIKITGSSKLFTLALVCCSFMCADDILQQYVYSTIQYNTILSKGVFSFIVLLRKTGYYYCVICILFWSILMQNLEFDCV